MVLTEQLTTQIAKTAEYERAHQKFLEGKIPFPNTGLSINDQISWIYREGVRQELADRLDGQFWISEDIAMAEDCILLAGETKNVTIVLPETEKLGPLGGLNEYAFSLIYSHTRSRFAQIGLEVLATSGHTLAETVREKEINGKMRKVAEVTVSNHAAAPIELKQGAEFFCLYYWDGKTIEGEELVKSVGSEILLSGEEGVDWAWWRKPTVNGELSEIQGIELFLDPTSFTLTPLSDEPINLHHGADPNHNRGGVDQLLRPLKHDLPQNQERLYIGETKARLDISSNMHAILDPAATRYGDGPVVVDKWFYQTNSLILRGGNTHNRIRVEVQCDGRFPSSVFILFAPASKKKET